MDDPQLSIDQLRGLIRPGDVETPKIVASVMGESGPISLEARQKEYQQEMEELAAHGEAQENRLTWPRRI